MKNISFLLLITSSFVFSTLTLQCTSPAVATEISNPEKDKPAQFIETIKYYKVDVNTGEKMHAATDYFDENGNKTKSINYDSGEEVFVSNVFSQSVNEYNENGDLIKSTTTDADGKVTYVLENKYEGTLKVEELTIYQKTIFKYNKNGDLERKEEYDLGGKFKKGEKKEYKYVEGTSNPQRVTVFKKYGEGDFEKYSEETYSYTENGNLKQKSVRTSFNEYHYAYQYHPNENLKESLTMSGENEKTIEKFNVEGQRILEEIFRKEGPDFPFELDWTNMWTYDKYGNEIMSESTQKDKVVRKHVREITYYKH